jgi:hypothetical protein
VANTLTITVENPTALRDTDLYGTGALIRTQSSATEAGAYTDITGSDTTVLLVDDQRAYTVNDPLGAASTWYRTRFENAGATRVSDWSPVFQTGDETGGLLCSLFDVKQDLGIASTDTSEDETILEKIRQVSAAIEGFTGRWFVPRPTDPASTTIYRVHSRAGYRLELPKGIRSITTLGVAINDQPASGGTYTTLSASSYYLDPPEMERDANWPATRVCLSRTGGAYFYSAAYGVEITGSFGWASVPYDIQSIAMDATKNRYQGKESGTFAVPLGPTGAVTILRGISPEARDTLNWYRDLSA